MRFDRILACLPLALAAGCLPDRDNPFDPTVRPRPDVVATVEGQASVTGGRYAHWVIDASASEDEGGGRVDSYSWELSTGPAHPADLEEVPGWEPVGDTAVIDTSDASGAAFRAAIVQIRDFSDEGYGATQRTLRLTVADGARKATVAMRLTFVNSRPTVSLGPDLRIAPGGRWWVVDPEDTAHDVDGDDYSDVFDAPPRQVVVRVRAEDPDAGETAVLLSAEYPARWRVHGFLAEQLDADRDGVVDDGFFLDAGHSTLAIDAPLLPSTTRFFVDVGDVRTDDGDLRIAATDEVLVDVGSSHWIVDHASGIATRMSRRPLDRIPHTPFPIELLASDVNKLLYANVNGGNTELRLTDHRVGAGDRRNNLTFASDAALLGASACSDGASGWWVLLPALGELRHVAPDLQVAQTLTDLDGGGDDLAVTAGGVIAGDGGRIWLLAAGTGEPLLFARATDGTWSSRDPFPGPEAAYALEPDGKGGIVVLGRETPTSPTRAVRFAPDGTPLFDRTIHAAAGTTPIALLELAYDAENDAFWATGTAAQSQVFVHWPPEEEEGTLVPIPYAVRDVFFDLANGGVLVACDLGILRIGADLSISSGATLDHILADAIFTDAGSAFGLSFESGSGYVISYFETGLPDTAATLELPIDAVNANKRTVVVDPGTGFLWVLRQNEGGFREVAPSGEELRFVSLPFSGLDTGIAASIDLDSRRVWIAWSQGLPGGGGLGWFDADDDAPEFRDVTGLDPFLRITDVDVLPGGRTVCVAGTRISPFDDEDALVFQPAASGTSGQITGFDLHLGASTALFAEADTRDGACWFAGIDPSTTVGRVPEGAGSLSIKGNLARSAWTPVKDHWGDVVLAPSYSHTDTDWIVLFTPGATLGDPYSPNPADAAPDIVYPVGLLHDPFYGHLLVGFESSFLENGSVIRLNRGFRVLETHPQPGFSRPFLAAPF